MRRGKERRDEERGREEKKREGKREMTGNEDGRYSLANAH